MKNPKCILHIAILTAAPFVFAQGKPDPVIENTLEARRFMGIAAQDYNSAVGHILNSDALLRENISRATGVSKQFASLETASERISKKLEYVKDKMRLLNENFKQGCNSLEFAKKNLVLANASIPIGNRRFELAENLYKQGFELAAKNPGRNYEDKAYFDNIWSSLMRAKAQFQETQKDAAKLALTLSIANPRIDGIEATQRLAKDFLEKTAVSVDENKETTTKMRGAVASLYDDSMKAYEGLTEQMARLGEARSEFTNANFAISVFVMNDLPLREKYFETIFQADAYFLSALAGDANSFAKSVKRSVALGSDSQYESIGESADSKEKNTYAGFAARAPIAQSSASRAMSAAYVPSATPENMRGELLDITIKIGNLAAEISQANALLSDIITEARSSVQAIEMSEYDMQTLLRTVIGFYGESQSCSSELQIFKNSMGVNISQSKVSLNEFKKLCESADKSIKACIENTSNGYKKLEAARAVLK